MDQTGRQRRAIIGIVLARRSPRRQIADTCDGTSSVGIRDMVAKADFVQAYFSRWDNDLDRAKTLLAAQEYYLEAMLVLSCHIGALASLRFPTLADNAAYKRVVLEYSGMRDFYEQIDLLFFLQWPRSEFSSHGDFLKLKNHAELAEAVEVTFRDEDTVRQDAKRYVSQQDFLEAVRAALSPGLISTISDCICRFFPTPNYSTDTFAVVPSTVFIFPSSAKSIFLMVAYVTTATTQ